MSTVIVDWLGQCPSHEVQCDLLRYVDELARCSHGFLAKPPVKCDEPLEPLQIKRWDNRIEGRILLSSRFLSPEAARRYGIDLVNDMPLLGEADVHGTEFELYNPGDWDSYFCCKSSNRMSFVFLTHQCPELDGQLVEVLDHSSCQAFKDEALKQADWHLTYSGLALREYLDNWWNCFMGWIKYFLIPGLQYANIYLSEPNVHRGYQLVKAWLDEELVKLGDRSLLKQEAFEFILDWFRNAASASHDVLYGGEYSMLRIPKLEYWFGGRDVWMSNEPQDELGEIDRWNPLVKRIPGDPRQEAIPITRVGMIDREKLRRLYCPDEAERHDDTDKSKETDGYSEQI